jgi:hypothetical protein
MLILALLLLLLSQLDNTPHAHLFFVVAGEEEEVVEEAGLQPQPTAEKVEMPVLEEMVLLLYINVFLLQA